MFKELLHKLSYRKIELISRIDGERSKTLMGLINNKNIDLIQIEDRLYLSKYYKNEERTTKVNIQFKDLRNLLQYRDNMILIEKLDLPFKKYMDGRYAERVRFSCDIDDINWCLIMDISHDLEEEKRMELLGKIMDCEIIKITTQHSEYTTESFACKNR